MDGVQASVTSLAIIVIVLIMALLVCHFIGPKATAWVQSNREEKIGLSKSKLYNANGYLMHSGSEILLSSTGSFKRFDSIDRDYKQIGQTSLNAPAWNTPAPEIPPQPLRPAPASITISTKNRKQSMMDKSLKQQSCEFISATAIPRPIAKRQLSSPAGITTPINLSETVAKISNSTRSCTNPFLNGSLSIPENDNHLCEIIDNKLLSTESPLSSTSNDIIFTVEQEKFNNNPFSANNNNLNDNTSINENNILNHSFEYNGHLIEVEIDRNFLQNTTNNEFINLNENIFNNRNNNKNQGKEQNERNAQNELNVNDKELENNSIKNNLCSVVQEEEEILTQMELDADNIKTSNFRSRSHSETEVNGDHDNKDRLFNLSLMKSQLDITNYSKNPFITAATNKWTNLHKTLSENYLEQYSIMNTNRNYTTIINHSGGNNNHVKLLTDGSRMLNKTNSMKSLGSQNSIVNDIHINRAISCESVSSESSVIQSDLELPTPTVTGLLCVGLQYDKNSMSAEGCELVLTVMEAKELIIPSNAEIVDTFVKMYLVPDEMAAQQTRIFKNSLCPSYNETFCFWLNKKRIKRSIWFHLYHVGSVHTLIGEAEMQIGDVTRPITTWLTLSDSRYNNSTWGELMFALSYLPTAERLTVVIVKGRNFKLNETDDHQTIKNVFVKVYLLKNDKKVSKKKTIIKRTDHSPIFNESVIFSVPPYALCDIQIRLTVVNVCYNIGNDSQLMEPNINFVPIGHVIVGSNVSDKGQRHWNQMISSLRKPIAMWHALRKTAKQ